MSRSGSIIADPNPILVPDSSLVGATNLVWASTGTTAVEVHVGAPDGPLLSGTVSSGSTTTGKWVQDGMVFYLQDVSNGLALTPENTLATLTVNVTPGEGIYSFAAFLGQRLGCTHIIDIGCGTGAKLAPFHLEFEIIGVDFGTNVKLCQERYPFGTWVEKDLDRPGSIIQLPEDILSHAIIVCANVIDQLVDPTYLLDNIRDLLEHAPACLLSTPERILACGEDNARHRRSSAQLGQWKLVQLESFLRSKGFNLAFIGTSTYDDFNYEEKMILAVIAKTTSENEPFPVDLAANVPSDFRVVAIMTAYNEEDIIIPSIKCLIDQGIDVYLIDNWSTDATYALAKQLEGRGLIGIERFPKEGPSPYYHWRGLLRRVEELAGEIEADWLIHHDVDEVRVAPWAGVSLRQGIYLVDLEGFNCIDHTVIEFHPVDNGFVPGTDFESYFKCFEFGKRLDHFVQIKAWKNFGQYISLADTGGHEVRFEGRQIYPYKFLLKHYPFRSQAHGERKVLLERKLRWDPKERASGLHVHYDDFREDHAFLRPPFELEFFDEVHFNRKYLVERLSGVGILRRARVAEKEQTVQTLRAQVAEKDQAVQALQAQVAEIQTQAEVNGQALQAQVADRDAEISRITSSLGWRLLSRWGRIKYRYLLPVYRLLGLMPSGPKPADTETPPKR